MHAYLGLTELTTFFRDWVTTRQHTCLYAAANLLSGVVMMQTCMAPPKSTLKQQAQCSLKEKILH